jgi:hypothetical protein
MHDLPHYLHVIIGFFRDGFHEGYARVNALLGLLIAVVAVYSMHEWKRIWMVALGATLAYLVAQWALPILDQRAPIRLPPELLEYSYWQIALALYFGFLVVVAVFFLMKKMLIPGGAKH